VKTSSYPLVLIAMLTLALVAAASAAARADDAKAAPSGFIGLSIERTDTGRVLVRKVEKGSPAEQAGMLADDELVSVDGTNVAHLASGAEVAAKMRGSAGSPVQIMIKRKEEQKTFTIVRASTAEAARRHIVRGAAAIEMAKSEADLARAAAEFEQAAEIAPTMAPAWYNLGSVQAKIGELKEAIESYRKYLALAPQADDAQRIRDEVIKLEYRLEQADSFKNLSGYWISKAAGNLYRVDTEGGKLTLRGRHWASEGAIIHSIAGKNNSYDASYCLAAGLTERGGNWVGSWEVPGLTFPTACTIPVSQAEIEAQLDEAKGRITLKITRPKFKASVHDPGIFSSKWACGGVSNTGTIVEEDVLLGPLPGGCILANIIGEAAHTLLLTNPGPAEEKAGLKTGDHIVSIDGADLSQMGSFAEARLKLYDKPGSVAQLVVKREQKGKGRSAPMEALTISVPRTDLSTGKISVCGE
jgi:tetratricopeptide (TPR) repeat protein